MLQRIDLRGVNTSRAVLADRLPRAALNVEKAMEIVAPLIEDVRARGGAALRGFIPGLTECGDFLPAAVGLGGEDGNLVFQRDHLVGAKGANA